MAITEEEKRAALAELVVVADEAAAAIREAVPCLAARIDHAITRTRKAFTT